MMSWSSLRTVRGARAVMSATLVVALSGCLFGDVCEEFPNYCATGGAGASGAGGAGAAGGTGGDGGTGAQGAAGGEGGTGGGPNPVCLPTEGEAIGAECGVFVDASAGGGGDGSQRNPYASIAEAVANLRGAEHIYVCGDGTFVNGAGTSLELPADVALSGGLTCSAWVYGEANPRPTIVGAADQAAVSLVGAGQTTMTSIIIEGADPTAAGGSSVGLLASERTVDALRVMISAAAGTAGTAGADAPQTSPAAGQGGTPGNPAPACGVGGLNVGGAEEVNDACASGTSVGGAGGDATASQGNSGLAGTAGSAGQGGLGQPNMGMWSCVAGAGVNGETGSAGPAGSAGSAKGTLSSSGFVGDPGGLGGNGGPGQGGGGGGGSRGLVDCNPGMAGNQPRTGASGGSGGSGGCGGVGAMGGTAGGSSFAVVLLNATATFTESVLTAAGGGAGGDGGRGQPGAGGGFGANGGTGDIPGGIENACRGGDGGTGGRGGGGGGGRGGHSAAIVFEGTAPTLDETTTSAGAAGAGGVGQGLNPGDAGTLGSSCELMDFGGASEVCL